MTVLIASLENPQHNERFEQCFPEYNADKKEFSLNRPIGDDWGQYIRHIPNPSPVLVLTEARVMFVVFDATAMLLNLKNGLRMRQKNSSMASIQCVASRAKQLGGLSIPCFAV